MSSYSAPQYPFAEFMKHYEAFAQLERPSHPSLEGSVIRLRDRLAPEYPAEDELVFKVTRFTLILRYVAMHMGDFDVGEYGVEGSAESGSLVNEHVLRAVHHLFVENSPFPRRDPSPEAVLHLARQYRDGEAAE